MLNFFFIVKPPKKGRRVCQSRAAHFMKQDDKGQKGMKKKRTARCAICGKEFVKDYVRQRCCSPECKEIYLKKYRSEYYKKNSEDLKRWHGLYRKAIKQGRRAEMLDLEDYACEVGKSMLRDVDDERYAGGIPELERTLIAAADVFVDLKQCQKDIEKVVTSSQYPAAATVSHIRGAARSLAWIAGDLDYRARVLSDVIEKYFDEDEEEGGDE